LTFRDEFGAPEVGQFAGKVVRNLREKEKWVKKEMMKMKKKTKEMKMMVMKEKRR